MTKISLDFPLLRMASIMGSAPCNLRVNVFNGVLLSLYSLEIPYLPFSVVIKVISPKNKEEFLEVFRKKNLYCLESLSFQMI